MINLFKNIHNWFYNKPKLTIILANVLIIAIVGALAGSFLYPTLGWTGTYAIVFFTYFIIVLIYGKPGHQNNEHGN